MKRLILNALLIMSGSSGYAWAAGETAGGGGMLAKLFLLFLATIVVFQLIPGLVLFGSMLKGLFTRSPGETTLMRKGGKSA